MLQSKELATLRQPASTNSSLGGNVSIQGEEPAIQAPKKKKAGYINFHTPKNDRFYSESPYLKLDPTRKEIRLLKVSLLPPGLSLKQRQETPLSCELVDKVSLSRLNGSYCALSYCAGSPKSTKNLLVNGLRFNAFANLDHAIRCALNCWTAQNPSKEMLLWTDQICINQSDPKERASQVRLMGDIYRRSSVTYICLSMPDHPDCISWIADHINPREDWNENYDMRDYFQDRLTHIAPTFELFKRWLNSFENFLKSPWWSRAWVYQEFIVSRPYLVDRDCSIAWAEVSPLLNRKLDTLLESSISYLMRQVSAESRRYQAGLREEKESHLSKQDNLRRKFENVMRDYDQGSEATRSMFLSQSL